MESFNELIKNGIKNVYEKDLTSQQVYIKNICEKVRNIDDDIIYKFEGFFVPNDDYMKTYFGTGITQRGYDCYSEGNLCHWLGYLVFPVYNLIDEVVGLVGFNPVNKLKAVEEQMWDINYYRLASKMIFDKGKYLFMLNGTYRKALEDGYIIITDGVFDTISFTANGLNSGALLGSVLSEEIIVMLSFIDKVYISVDNDEAGLTLERNLKRKLSNVRAIKQNRFKDADDILKSKYRNLFLKKFRENLSTRIKTDFIFRV